MIIERKLNTFCETPEENCTMNYCNDNGCNNRKRELADIDVEVQVVVPKEEQVVETTLEEAVQKVANSDDFINGALFGAKWQSKRMYSEEDLRESFIEGYKQRAEKSDLIFDNASRMYAIHLFEQFKKK